MNIDWIDLLKRAAWTFLEAFLVALPTTYTINENGWKSALISALLSACAAGVSAVKTLLVNLLSPVEDDDNEEQKAEQTAKNSYKIYLSPSGQTGNEYAKPYNYTNECEQCVKISQACENALVARGFEVMNGAGKNYDVRYAEAKEFKPSLYLPIHTNGFDGVVSGTRMFIYQDGDEGHRICRYIFKYLDACCPGTSSNIKETGDKWEEMRVMHKYGIDNCYAECDFHDVPTVAEFIVNHTTEIGESIAHGICDAFDVAW